MGENHSRPWNPEDEKYAQPWQNVRDTKVKYRYLKITKFFGDHDALQWMNENDYKVSVKYYLIYTDKPWEPNGHIDTPTEHHVQLSEKSNNGYQSDIFYIAAHSDVTDRRTNPIIVDPVK